MKTTNEEPVQLDLERFRQRIEELMVKFESQLRQDDLRQKVLALIPILYALRDVGKALIPSKYASAARDRILYYFRK
jgi:CRISPR/Cas system-associated endonuclease Cas3-HD